VSNRIKANSPLSLRSNVVVSKFISFHVLALLTLMNVTFYVKNRNNLFVGQAVTTNRFLEEFANSDRATMLALALNLGKESQSEYSWILNLWPPGSAILNFIILQFTSNIYLIQYSWAMLIFLLWMLVAYKAIKISSVNQRAYTIVILFMIFNNPVFHFKFYTSTMLMSDSIATPLGIGALLFLYDGLNKKSYNDLLVFGILISGAAHFRGIWMKQIEFLIIIGIFIFVVQAVRNKSKGLGKKTNINVASKLFFGGSLAYLLTIPYRLIQVAKGKSFFKWGMDDSQMWASSWINPIGSNSWLENSGINPACSIDPFQCRAFAERITDMEILASAAKHVFFENPIAWLLFRAKYIYYGLVSDYDIEMPDLRVSFFGIFIVACFALFILLILRIASSRNYNILILLIPCLADFGSMMYFHVENRYFLPSVMLCLITIAIFGPKQFYRKREVGVQHD
jgi:hypothetical protein